VDTPAGLFITDIDGTLMPPGGVVPERAKRAIAAANEAGVVVGLVTGRRLRSALLLRRQLEGLSYRLAVSNGSVIVAPDLERPESVRTLPWQLAGELADHEALRVAPLIVVLAPPRMTDSGDETDCLVRTSTDRHWMSSDRPLMANTLRPSTAPDEERRSVVHLALHFPDREQAIAAELELIPDLATDVETHVVAHPIAEGALLEFVPRGGKALAMKYFAMASDISPERTGAVGDELNDASLVDAAHFPFTIGGSVLAAHRPEFPTVGTAAEGGAGEALELFLEQLKP
jgi:hydroxymethylpyrimidine pyrophosphatase-like HAD family hydrolase